MSSSSINLSSLLKVAGDDIIRAYQTKYFTTGIIEASGDFLSNKNVINWVNAENFQHFVVEWLQVPTPCTPQIIESSTSASALPLRHGDSQSPPPITWVTPNKSTGTRQQWVKQLVELTEIPTTSLPSSSYHPTSAEPFYASLPPELEPPTSAEPFYSSLSPELEPPTSTKPFYASLPPKLEPPPSSYKIHLSYLQQSRLYTNSEPVFPSATCPPNLRSNQ
ncbi:hypothetical protein BU17DRAFT_79647 [Hysterangium stoloniferum]|nr:hypothetical protein BU17DRAFT_79647 [Hysterangium stoloniferum]